MTFVPQTRAKGAFALYLVISMFTLGLVLLLFAAGIKGATQSDNTLHPATVSISRVSVQTGFNVPINVYGLVESPKESNLSFDTAGQVVSIYFDEGERVAKGDVIATLDRQRLQARLVELEASLARANADLTLARVSEKRVTTLVAKKLESSQRLDEVNANADAADAQVKEIEAAINSLHVELSKTRLVAPYDGVVSGRYIDEGGVVAAGTPLVNLTSSEQYQVRFAIPADTISRFSTGQEVTLQVGEKRVDAKVSQISPIRNQQTRTIDLLVDLVSNTGIRPGDTAILRNEKHNMETGAWIPVTALSNGIRGLWRIFVVLESQGNTNKVALETRTVEVVYTDGERAFVRGALSNGDTIVNSGTHKLSPGQVVLTQRRSRQGGVQ